jgi:hypothetical protein
VPIRTFSSCGTGCTATTGGIDATNWSARIGTGWTEGITNILQIYELGPGPTVVAELLDLADLTPKAMIQTRVLTDANGFADCYDLSNADFRSHLGPSARFSGGRRRTAEQEWRGLSGRSLTATAVLSS